MKKLTLTFVFMMALTIVMSQPSAFKYQTVVRDGNGETVTSQLVSFQLAILQGDASGTNVYTETHATNTNQFGLANLEIGNGSVVSGDFTTIDWGADDYFLEISFDINGGTNYLLAGTSQLMAVPYALYAKNSGGSSAWQATGDDIYFNEGNVGIGTDSPSNKLDVYANNIELADFVFLGRMKSATDLLLGHNMMARIDGVRGAHVANDWPLGYAGIRMYNGDIQFHSKSGYVFEGDIANNEVMRLTNYGTLGIGITNPDPYRKLHLHGGDLLVEAPDWADLTIRTTDPGTDAFLRLRTAIDDQWDNDEHWTIANDVSMENKLNFIYLDDRKLTITKEGNVGIGTTNPQSMLEVAGRISQSGTGNSVFIGNNAGLNDNANNNANVGIGAFALYTNIDKKGIVAIGDSALFTNGTGATEPEHASQNTALGSKSLFSNTSGYRNTAVGYHASNSNLNGFHNTSLGVKAMLNNISGYGNTACGVYSNYHSTGNYNTGIGASALTWNLEGSNNTAVGGNALSNMYWGTGTSALGYYAGGEYFMGGTYYYEYCTLLGSYSRGPENFDTISNSTAIGYYSYVPASNMIRVGNTGVASIGGYANWTNMSDKRFKKNIQENVPGLNFILKLRPLTYQEDINKLNDFINVPDSLKNTLLWQKTSRQKENATKSGFIAQEVEEIAKSIGYEFSGVDIPRSEQDHYGLRYAEFVVPLVKAIQEQQQMIEEQKTLIEELNYRIRKLEDYD